MQMRALFHAKNHNLSWPTRPPSVGWAGSFVVDSNRGRSGVGPFSGQGRVEIAVKEGSW